MVVDGIDVSVEGSGAAEDSVTGMLCVDAAGASPEHPEKASISKAAMKERNLIFDKTNPPHYRILSNYTMPQDGSQFLIKTSHTDKEKRYHILSKPHIFLFRGNTETTGNVPQSPIKQPPPSDKK